MIINRKHHLLFGLLLSTISFSGCFKEDKKQVEQSTDLSGLSFYAGLKLSALYGLLDTLGYQGQYEKTVPSLVALTQKEWLRKGERWETEDKFEEQKNELEPYFNELDLIKTWAPSEKQYNGLLFTGATVVSMNSKLNLLVSYIDQGIKLKEVVILTGQRFITEKEKKDIIELGGNPELIKTETDAAQFLFDQQHIKEKLNGVVITVVDAPETIKPDGTKQRPTTGDTVHAWLKQGALPGLYLVISQQPYCNNQKVVLETILPSNYTLDVIGKGDNYHQTRVALYLDTLARTLYQQSKA